MGKSDKEMNKVLFENKMWHNWRSLYSYFDCLKDEDSITDETWTSMNNYLMELKSLLPGERD